MEPAGRRLRAVLVTTLVLVVAAPLLVFGAGIELPGTQPVDGEGLAGYPPFRNGPDPGRISRPGLCDNCHADYRSAGQAMYEQFDSWAGSLMAQAARDPLFWAALDIANQDDDDKLGGLGIGDLCLRCHVPAAWIEGRSHCDTPWGQRYDGACLTGSMDQPDNDFEGISCHLCHRLYDASNPPPGEFADPAAPYPENAQIYVSSDHLTMLGPFTDCAPFSHLFLGSSFHRSSALCGQCHEVSSAANRARDAVTGTDLGFGMPLERTYSEWRQSRYADPAAPEHATCQDCHMPEPDLDGDGTPDAGYACSQEIGLRGNGTTLQGPLRNHVFAGAATWLLTVINGEYGDALGRTAQLDNGIAAAARLLTTRTVTVNLSAPAGAVAGDTLPVSVRVTNLGGHKFPTGHQDGRRGWLQLAAGEDADGDGRLSPAEVQFESAAYDAATAELTKDPQAKIYEPLIGVWNWNGTGECDLVDAASGSEMFHQVLNNCFVEDNRIPPLGFTPSPDTTPFAHPYPDNPALPGTLANWDDTTYAVPIPATVTRPFLLRARVYLQSVSKEYIEFLRDQNRSTCDPFDDLCDPTQPDPRLNRGEKLFALWEKYGRGAPVELSSAESTVAITIPEPGACCILGACEVLPLAECRDREGAFAGPATTCSPSTCPLPEPPPGEASNVLAGAAPLRVTGADRVTGAVSFTHAPACDATDHAVSWGRLSDVATMTMASRECGLGVGGSGSFHPGHHGDWFFVVVGLNATAEGSYGRDSFGAERAQATGHGPCDAPQDLSGDCD